MRDIKQAMWSKSFLDTENLECIYQRLIAMREEGREQTRKLREEMAQQKSSAGDEADQTMRESEYHMNARLYNHYKEKLEKIDAALMRIMHGRYGYCLETGEEISLSRLMVNPLAELCGEAQRDKELRVKFKGAA